MRFAVILNRGGGTLRSLDLGEFAGKMTDMLRTAGHEAEVEIIDGEELMDMLDRAVARADLDVVMIGGGDGSVSAAAGRLMDTDKALAVLPAGTMNLFARSLAIPLQLDAAVEALSGGVIRPVDIASANGKAFVHQFSIGMHPKLIRLREQMEFRSRWGKIHASVKAAIDTLRAPPRMRVQLTIDGEEHERSTNGIGVTNNLFGEGHLPYADDPDGGRLGVYVSVARGRRELAKFFLNMAVGRWEANDQVDIFEAEEVIIKVRSAHKRTGCAVDGELCGLSAETTLRIHKKALKVLVPSDQGGPKP
ncbi:diacylglycerol kinase family protein [Aquamicrobium sp. LC103]|uniref:diacylglycerol/lipid kinase family protein n=1 Tax=Aquamicrobium sp. LC103 TaxID=1120658 RepID=UPI00063ED208|nr:diacylglycerol kinase family protein [Aquamicrobium sp. LC103]TKT75313.1 diacylglycerol kinase family lipid kinase [Aquamicrobium sp. LC103]